MSHGISTTRVNEKTVKKHTRLVASEDVDVLKLAQKIEDQKIKELEKEKVSAASMVEQLQTEKEKLIRFNQQCQGRVIELEKELRGDAESNESDESDRMSAES